MSEPAYISWAGSSKEREKAFVEISESVGAVRVVKNSSRYLDIGPAGTSLRGDFTREDYERIRPHETIPKKGRKAAIACMDAYDTVSVIRNTIDLMSEFTALGMNIYHANKRVQKFYRRWFKLVKGFERSERIANTLYRAGTSIIRRQYANLPLSEEKRMNRVVSNQNIQLPSALPRQIPWKYIVYNPRSVDLISGELATLIGDSGFIYGIPITTQMRNLFTQAKPNAIVRKLLSKIPTEIINYIKDKNNKHIPFPQEHVVSLFYKKDDDEQWGVPIIYSILEDVRLLKKMKLADLSALDGMVSAIRVWRLGSLQHQIHPNEGMINKLTEILTNSVGGGVADIVWGPDIDVVETSAESYKFLGETKYEPVLMSIHSGIGVPPTLTGMASKGSSGMTNNSISLQTLVKRLNYGRKILEDFWDAEFRLVQSAMGFAFPAKMSFRNIFNDEVGEKNLLLGLADRGVISDELLREYFGVDSDIEDSKVRAEFRRRKRGIYPAKAGPYNDADMIPRYYLNTGLYSSEQFGWNFSAAPAGAIIPNDVLDGTSAQPTPTKQKGQKGRPLGKKDSTTRKQKSTKPLLFSKGADVVSNISISRNAMKKISNIINPVYLKSVNKNNMRELNVSEAKSLQRLSFFVLQQFKPGDSISDTVVKNLLSEDLKIGEACESLLSQVWSKHLEKYDSVPSLSQELEYYCSINAISNMED